MDIYKMDMEKDPLFRGEFDVVKQLISERPEMVAAKKRVRSRKLIFLKHMAEAAISHIFLRLMLNICRRTSWSIFVGRQRLVGPVLSSSGRN